MAGRAYTSARREMLDVTSPRIANLGKRLEVLKLHVSAFANAQNVNWCSPDRGGVLALEMGYNVCLSNLNINPLWSNGYDLSLSIVISIWSRHDRGSTPRNGRYPFAWRGEVSEVTGRPELLIWPP